MNIEKYIELEEISNRSFKLKNKIIIENKETAIYERNNNYNRRFCDG